jgi:hypothetical protein
MGRTPFFDLGGGRERPFERTFAEDFFGPTTNFVEVDAKDTKRLRVCLVGRA